MSEFNFYYKKIPIYHTSVKGSIIDSGLKEYIPKVLLGCFFAELLLQRIALLAYNASSGIYTTEDHKKMFFELAGCMQALHTIEQDSIFAGRNIFPARNRKKVTIKTNIHNIQVELVPLLPKTKLFDYKEHLKDSMDFQYAFFDVYNDSRLYIKMIKRVVTMVSKGAAHL